MINFKSYGNRNGKINHETDNLLIKGNNLLALHSLLPKYRGRVKLIYIDPPYNTGNDGFKYNDAFNHSTWLVFMKNRLEVARQLLSDDGTIYINIDQTESHYLKVLADDIFHRDNFRNEIIWKYTGGLAPVYDFPRKHDNILRYSKKDKYFFNHTYEEYSDVDPTALIGRYNWKSKPEVLHAESNAIAKLAKSTESGANATMFITHSPCLDCAKLIYQSGINSVIYRNSYRSDDGIIFLNKSGVKVEKLEGN